MKFINAKFFYEANKLIDESKYSYWWILMGELKTKGATISAANNVVSTWNTLQSEESSYKIKNSTQVELNNAYICGMSKAALPPTVKPGDTQGTVILTASGSDGTSKIPFTVGQNKKDVGHMADSLWLLALNKSINEENVLSLFPFTADGETSGSDLVQKSTCAPEGDNFKLEYNEETSNYIPLIGYNVNATEPVNSINYSGFTVGESVVTLSGLIS